jgi:hypothetical protein
MTRMASIQTLRKLKVEDIKSIPAPSNKQELQELLSIVTYLGPFMPQLSHNTAILRDLLKQETDFQWMTNHDKAFNALKGMITKEVTLAYFDPKKATTIQVDASTRGLGAALLQEDRPIAFASKSLTPTEQRYANIEREMLAVVFGCQKFHTYVYGKPFTVESDHKPLEMICTKNISAAPPRLQRMLLELQGYDQVIRYRPGKEITLADGLSRLPNKANNSEIELDVKISFVQFSENKLCTLKEETRKDPGLAALKEIIMDGWSEKCKDLPTPLKPYWSFRDELAIEDSIILKGARVVIPASMKKEILEKIHTPHMGVTKSQLRARSCVYWLGIDKDIATMTQQCDICQQYQNAQTKETLISHEIPSRPWQILSSDLFHLDGDNYLLICDHYSKYPYVRKYGSQYTCSTTVNIMKQIFGEQGIPEKLVTDNGPQFACNTMKKFAHEWGFEHVTSSPHYPQSNGFIERTVQTVKGILEKCKDSGTDPNIALLCLRTTPVDHHIPSPSELLFTRKIRANLPTKIDNPILTKDRIYQQLTERQEKQKQYYDRGTKDLPPLIPDQPILVQHPQTHQWKKAVVEEKCEQPRSYKVTMEDGHTLRRNRRHIRERSAKTTEEHGQITAEPKEDIAVKEPPNTPRRSGRETSKPQRLLEQM